MSRLAVDIAEAAALTGRTVKAIRNRCDRGEVRFSVRHGKRFIPIAELKRAGLLEEDDELRSLAAGEPAELEPRELVSRELLRELAKAHEELGAHRLLEQRAGAERAELEAELDLVKKGRDSLEANREGLARELEELRIRREGLELELAELRSRGLLARLLNR